MTYRLEFEILGLPRMTNASGRSKHWAVMAGEAKKWKDGARHALRETVKV